MPWIITTAIALLILAALGPAFAEPQRSIIDGKRIQPRADVLAHIPQARLSRMNEAEVERLYQEVLSNHRRVLAAP